MTKMYNIRSSSLRVALMTTAAAVGGLSPLYVDSFDAAGCYGLKLKGGSNPSRTNMSEPEENELKYSLLGKLKVEENDKVQVNRESLKAGDVVDFDVVVNGWIIQTDHNRKGWIKMTLHYKKVAVEFLNLENSNRILLHPGEFDLSYTKEFSDHVTRDLILELRKNDRAQKLVDTQYFAMSGLNSEPPYLENSFVFNLKTQVPIKYLRNIVKYGCKQSRDAKEYERNYVAPDADDETFLLLKKGRHNQLAPEKKNLKDRLKAVLKKERFAPEVVRAANIRSVSV